MSTTIPSSYRLAKLTGFHRAHVHRVLHLRGGASLDFAIRLARAAGITLDELAAYAYRDNVLMPILLQTIDDRRAEWLSEEAKKRLQSRQLESRQLSASNGNGRGSKPSKPHSKPRSKQRRK